MLTTLATVAFGLLTGSGLAFAHNATIELELELERPAPSELERPAPLDQRAPAQATEQPDDTLAFSCVSDCQDEYEECMYSGLPGCEKIYNLCISDCWY